VITGLFAALAALWAARAYRLGVSVVASWTVSLTGLWAAVAPFVLGYEHDAPAVANDMIVGLAIFILAMANVIAKEHRLERESGDPNHRNRIVTA
jgi:hypothetical protein